MRGVDAQLGECVQPLGRARLEPRWRVRAVELRAQRLGPELAKGAEAREEGLEV